MPDINEMFSIIDEFGDRFAEDSDTMAKLKTIRDGISEISVPKYSDSDVYDADGVKFSDKYLNVKRLYRERFFSTPEDAKDDQEDNIEFDNKSADISYEDLFQNREGD